MTEDDIRCFCQAALGGPPQAIDYPGGKDRRTVGITVDGRPMILSRRRSPGRAKLEAEVLRRLGPSGLAPALLHQEGPWLVQEFVPGKRLSQGLDRASDDGARRLLHRAAQSLIDVQLSGQRTGLDRMAPVLGARSDWVEHLTTAPAKLAQAFGLPAPEFDRAGARGLLTVPAPRFIKWDARPGNAILRQDGRICWIDWEHCGRRAATDDLAWLFADEWSPDCPAAETEAIAMLASASAERDPDAPKRFRAMAVLHGCIRLLLILNRKGEGAWWSRNACLTYDRVGVCRDLAQRVARRGARLSEASSGLQPLADVLRRVEAAL